MGNNQRKLITVLRPDVLLIPFPGPYLDLGIAKSNVFSLNLKDLPKIKLFIMYIAP
jgi:hypothetical protein